MRVGNEYHVDAASSWVVEIEVVFFQDYGLRVLLNSNKVLSVMS